MDEATDRPRRAVNPEVVERRQVREAIAKVGVGVEELQREAAFLSAMAVRGKSAAASDVAAARKKAESVKARLDAEVAKLPEQLRNHGRITDLKKAIASLEAHLPLSES